MDLTEAFTRAILAPQPTLSTVGFLEALGGVREGIRALALIRIGAPASGRLPAPGTARYTKYRSARRTIERWRNKETGAARQARTPDAKWLREHRVAVRAAATRRGVDRLRRRGSRNRIRAEIIVSADHRVRDLPAGGKGKLLTTAPTRRFTDPVLDGSFAAAAAVWLAVFLDAYTAGAGAEFAIGDVEWIRIWAHGDPEPTKAT